MNGHLPGPDVAVLVVYVIGVVAFGSYFVRRSRSTEGFMAAGRRLPGWAVGLSILGTYVSSISFLALPGKAYSANWNPFVFSLSLPIAAWIATRFFVPLRSNFLESPEPREPGVEARKSGVEARKSGGEARKSGGEARKSGGGSWEQLRLSRCSPDAAVSLWYGANSTCARPVRGAGASSSSTVGRCAGFPRPTS